MAMENIDDRVLVSAYINGNEQAFETLLMRHKDKIYRFIAMKVRDNALAEDIFQDAFIKVQESCSSPCDKYQGFKEETLEKSDENDDIPQHFHQRGAVNLHLKSGAFVASEGFP